jgi:hypothetical protein
MDTAETDRATGSIQGYFAGLSRNTFLLTAASLFADISTEMLYPVLPVFLTQTLRASGSIVGLVDGFAQATQNIVQGFSGALSDKLRNRKTVALARYLLAAIAKPLMGLATIWQAVFGARLLDRFGAGARSRPARALSCRAAGVPYNSKIERLLSLQRDRSLKGVPFGRNKGSRAQSGCVAPLLRPSYSVESLTEALRPE